jgi:transcription elongation factor Elf1
MESFGEIIKLRCAFCRSQEFAVPHEAYSPTGGGFVVCANCGMENDVTSLLVVAKAKGFSLAKDHATAFVGAMVEKLKNTLKNNKYIRFK